MPWVFVSEVATAHKLAAGHAGVSGIPPGDRAYVANTTK
jgi:hypothetical protein